MGDERDRTRDERDSDAQERPREDQAGFFGKRGHPPTDRPASPGQAEGTPEAEDTDRQRFEHDDYPLDLRRPVRSGSDDEVEGGSDQPGR